LGGAPDERRSLHIDRFVARYDIAEYLLVTEEVG